ncbi:MAG: methyltransferase domain-containing protein [Deltaproteobacteria bacterium]|jgi:ubiquinone/menaquinone biosynthesis C-methylase UbiE|nr:methyltransferase domain-containing protein [Deltaproteobacteria bacterium]
MSDNKWNPQVFMDLGRRFWTFCTINAAVELDLFTKIEAYENEAKGGTGLTVTELADRINSDGRAVGMLVTALVSLGLLTREGSTIRLTLEARRYLSTMSQDYYGHALLHQAHIMPAWIKLAQAVRTGQRVAQNTAAESEDEDQREAFLMAMFNSARFQAGEVARSLDLSGYKNLMDLGGGPGTYAAEFCLKYPNLSAVIFDLPGSKPVAGKILARLGMADRVKFIAGDYNSDPLPEPFDVVFISQVIHQESPEGAAALVSKAAGVLEKGGILVIQEFFIDDNLSGPAVSALFSLNMLVNTLGGQSYTYAQVEEIMKKAGLKEIRILKAEDSLGRALMVGTKA